MNGMPQAYSSIQAWMHDHLIGERALNLHAYIIAQGNLEERLARKQEQQLLDVEDSFHAKIPRAIPR